MSSNKDPEDARDENFTALILFATLLKPWARNGVAIHVAKLPGARVGHVP